MTNRRTLILLMLVTALLATVAAASFEEAVSLFEQRDYKSAVTKLEREITQGNDSARVRTLLGWSAYKGGDLARAKQELDRALSLNANDTNAF
jgi:Flp pilus assembly protein TadD